MPVALRSIRRLNRRGRSRCRIRRRGSCRGRGRVRTRAERPVNYGAAWQTSTPAVGKPYVLGIRAAAARRRGWGRSNRRRLCRGRRRRPNTGLTLGLGQGRCRESENSIFVLAGDSAASRQHYAPVGGSVAVDGRQARGYVSRRIQASVATTLPPLPQVNRIPELEVPLHAERVSDGPPVGLAHDALLAVSVVGKLVTCAGVPPGTDAAGHGDLTFRCPRRVPLDPLAPRLRQTRLHPRLDQTKSRIGTRTELSCRGSACEPEEN